MRKIPTPDQCVSQNAVKQTSRSPELSKEEYERQLEELHEKLAEELIPRYKGAPLCIEVTKYHDKVIKQVNDDYTEVGWKVKRTREGGAVLLRFSMHRGEKDE